MCVKLIPIDLFVCLFALYINFHFFFFSVQVEDYLTAVRSSPGFNNPNCVDNLKEVLGISMGIRATLVEHVLM